MKDLAFVSACFGDLDIKEYWDHVYPTVTRYCKKYNIDFYLYKEKLGDQDRSGQWSKILATKKHIEDYDWVVWIDADIMIMNHTIDIREYIDTDYSLIITSFCGDNQPFNTGLFFIEGKSDWSTNLLNEVYYGDNFYVKNPTEKFHEQSSLYECLKDRNEERVLIRNPPVIHKFWPMNFPDILDFHLYPESSKVKEFWNNKEKDFFHKGDFCVHMIGHESRGIEGRKKDYEILSDHILWHQ